MYYMDDTLSDFQFCEGGSEVSFMFPRLQKNIAETEQADEEKSVD